MASDQPRLVYFFTVPCVYCKEFEDSIWKPLTHLLVSADIMGENGAWDATRMQKVHKKDAESTHPGAIVTYPQLVRLANGREDVFPATELTKLYNMAESPQKAKFHAALLGRILAWAIGRPLLVKFWASWCGHCSAMAAAWEEVATTLNQKGTVRALDVESKHDNLMRAFNIGGFPTVTILMLTGDHTDVNERTTPAMLQKVRNAVPDSC